MKGVKDSMLGAKIFYLIFWGFVLIVFAAVALAFSPLFLLALLGEEMNEEYRD